MLCRFKLCFISIFICSSSLFAYPLSYEELQSKPKSLQKDYYIYRYIVDLKGSNENIRALRPQILRFVGTIKTAYEKKFPPAAALGKCPYTTVNNILDATLECKQAKMFPTFVAKLSPLKRDSLISELSAYPNSVNLLRGMGQTEPAKYFASTGNVSNFLNYYNYLGFSQKSAQYNFFLSAEFADKLAKDARFNKFLTDLVVLNGFTQLKKSFANINPESVKDETAFFLGVNFLKLDDPNNAIKFFNRARETFTARDNIDNATFWLYYLTQNKNYFDALLASKGINIYALWAKEQAGVKYEVSLLYPKRGKVSDYNYNDPFAWQALKTQVDNNKNNIEFLKNLAPKFNTQETIGEWIYIQNRITNFQNQYYPIVYLEEMKDFSLHQKALTLAIAKQESAFVNSAISTSYALGLMQFMPFLAKDIGNNQLKLKGFDQDFMFEPFYSIKFADLHLAWLEKYLPAPIFVAYAYNCGLGCTRKFVNGSQLFRNNKYEPFLSMELFPYKESRIYGKKVLANYYIYSNAFGSNTSMQTLLQKSILSADLK